MQNTRRCSTAFGRCQIAVAIEGVASSPRPPLGCIRHGQETESTIEDGLPAFDRYVSKRFSHRQVGQRLEASPVCVFSDKLNTRVILAWSASVSHPCFSDYHDHYSICPATGQLRGS